MQLANRPGKTELPVSYGVFRPERIAIRPDRILRIHGYRNLETVRPAIRKTADAIAKRAEEIIVPEVHYARVGIQRLRGDDLILENGVRFRSPAFPRFLGDAREIVVVVTTMGRAIDEEVITVMERFDPLDALFLETSGWLGIEQATRQFRDFLRALVGLQGYRISCRMGPGYSYKIEAREVSWPLEDQQQLFKVFDGIDLPIRLLESCAMQPKLSRSSIFGLVPGG
jgi:hypothetical protein